MSFYFRVQMFKTSFKSRSIYWTFNWMRSEWLKFPLIMGNVIVKINVLLLNIVGDKWYCIFYVVTKDDGWQGCCKTIAFGLTRKYHMCEWNT